MQRIVPFILFIGIGLSYSAAASHAREPYPLPPVDVFYASAAVPGEAQQGVNPAAPSIAKDMQEQPSVAPLPPDVGPRPAPPPDPGLGPNGEPLRIQPASSAMGSLTESDRDFARRAAELNNSQIALGKLAVWRAGQSEVASFGQHMINVHMAANNVLRTLLEARSVALPSGLDKEHQSARAQLGKISGAQFDREYIRGQMRDHVTATQLFRNEAEHGGDTWLKSWAGQMLPTLEQSTQLLRELSDSIKPGV